MESDPPGTPGPVDSGPSCPGHPATRTRLPGQRIPQDHPDLARPPTHDRRPDITGDVIGGITGGTFGDTAPEIRLPGQRISRSHPTDPAPTPARDRDPDATGDDTAERERAERERAERERARREDAEAIGDILVRWELGCVHRLRAATERARLSSNEYLVLAEIGIRPDGLTGAQVAGIVGLSTGGVTRILARLEEQELVERDPDPEDGRRIVAFATEAGRALVRDGEGDPSGPGVRLLLEGLGPGPVDDIRTFLGRATDRAYRQSRHLRDLRRRR